MDAPTPTRSARFSKALASKITHSLAVRARDLNRRSTPHLASARRFTLVRG